jgi:hypothetical protein
MRRAIKDAISLDCQFIFTVRASSVLAFTVFTTEEVAKKVGS